MIESGDVAALYTCEGFSELMANVSETGPDADWSNAASEMLPLRRMGSMGEFSQER